MLIGHSLLQGDPGMPCLSPAVFQYLVHGDVSLCYPAAEEIPLNMKECLAALSVLPGAVQTANQHM